MIDILSRLTSADESPEQRKRELEVIRARVLGGDESPEDALCRRPDVG